MKESPQMKENEKNMRAGAISLSGFLGEDTRSLIQILIDDDSRVRRLNRTHARIADKMKYFRDKGLAGLGEFITVDNNFLVKVETVRGKIPSPFEEDRRIIGKINTTVRNKKTDREITYTDMLIHLVESHGFYEGKGSPFRVDPETLISVLGVEETAED